jgi:ArsR family transcriptional regulator
MIPAENPRATTSDEELFTALREDPQKAERVAQMLRALANASRVRILATLCRSTERSVGDIAQTLELPQAITSQHLAALRLEGHVRARREGGYRYYSLAVPELRDLFHCIGACCRKVHGLTPAL